MKLITSLVLFSDLLVKILNVDECKLDSNINNISQVDVVVEMNWSALLSHMTKSWGESSTGDRDPLCVTFLEKPENNLECMISSIEDTINSIQRTNEREFYYK